MIESIERRTGLTAVGLSVLGAVATVGSVGYVLRARVLLLMAYGVVLLVGAIAMLGRRRIRIEVERSRLPARIREGQAVEVEITVSSRRRVQALVLEEQQHHLVAPPVRLLVPSLQPGSTETHAYVIAPSVRGVYDVGPLVAVWSDPFGMVRARTRLLPPAQIFVHPRVEHVVDRVLSRAWEDPPVRPPVSKPWPHGFEFYGMREYVSGDDPRRMVWRAVARTGRYLVREAEQGITDRVTIVLDTDSAAHAAGEPSPTLETAVRAAASLGMLHLADGFSITVETSSGPLVGPLRGRGAGVRFLDAMAMIRLGRASLPAALLKVLGDPHRDTHHVLVAPHLDHTSARLLRVLLERGSSLTFVHVVGDEPDPASVQRAGALGCEIVELGVGRPLAGQFRRAIGAGLRR